jgi:hypothetical protein
MVRATTPAGQHALLAGFCIMGSSQGTCITATLPAAAAVHARPLVWLMQSCNTALQPALALLAYTLVGTVSDTTDINVLLLLLLLLLLWLATSHRLRKFRRLCMAAFRIGWMAAWS